VPARASRAGQAKPCLLGWPRDDAGEHRHPSCLHPGWSSRPANPPSTRRGSSRPARCRGRGRPPITANASITDAAQKRNPSERVRARARTRSTRAGWSSRSRASAGFSSPRRSTCRARSAASGRQASPWRPIRSISARAARATSGAPSPSLRRPAPPRPRRQGVGRARRLTSGRVHGRAVSGTAVGAGRPAMSYCFGSAKMLISRLASSAEVKSLTYSSTKKSFTSMVLASR
jgi:hypothetical protein